MIRTIRLITTFIAGTLTMLALLFGTSWSSVATGVMTTWRNIDLFGWARFADVVIAPPVFVTIFFVCLWQARRDLNWLWWLGLFVLLSLPLIERVVREHSLQDFVQLMSLIVANTKI